MKTQGQIKKYYHYAFPMQTVLVTCNDTKGKTNVITLAWHTPISKKPPLYGISVAPKRYSYNLITKAKEFVINFVPYKIAEKANFCGTHTGKNTDKILETKLTLQPSTKISTPMINECYSHLECKLVDDIKLGDHQLLIGEIQNIQAEQNAFKKELLDITKIKPTLYLGDNTYTTLAVNKILTK